MLQTEKTKDLMEHINRIVRRMQHIKEVKNQLFEFTTEAQQLYSSFSQKIHKEMMVFQDKIVKTSLYSTQKTSYIINLAKVYRQFSIQLQKNSKINLINIQRIKNDDIIKQEQRLKKKCEFFQKEFEQYLQAQKNYNYNFNIYSNKCNDLDQIIRRYRSYQDPIAFYNQILTNEYVRQLDKQYNDCSNFQTTVVNDTQRLDQTRKWMGEHIKEINQYYVILLHFYLGIIEGVITCIVDPKKDQNSQKNKIGLRNSELTSLDKFQNLQLQKLNNLYSSQLNNKNRIDDNIMEEYSQLFNKSFAQSQLNSDYKFFYDRCDNIRNKKLKTTNEVFAIQTLLIAELKIQKINYNNFQMNYRQIEKDIFTNNGVQSFKKRFRKYFGPNFMEIQELCFIIIERQKKSLQKIGKSTQQIQSKLGKLLQNKQQSIKLFQKRTKMVLDDHLKLKEKTYSNSSVDNQNLKKFKQSIAQSFNELKKSFIQLEKNESQVDKLFFSYLKGHYQIIIKEQVNKNLSKILEKEKNRLNILQVLNVDSQIVLILKQDSRYQTLMNQCPKPNLYTTFQSLAKKKQYDETKKLLQMKENRLKNMIRPKRGCCGVTSQPIKHNVLSQHKCKLIITDKKHKGILNITSAGLIFEEITWIPFSDGLRLMIPSFDINSFDTKTVNQKESIEIATDFGNLIFQSKVCTEIIESMQKNIAFKPIREGSQKGGGKKNDSSSFLKNNTSTEYKLSFDKSANTSGNKLPVKNERNPAKNKTTDSIINDFLKKWREGNFLSEHFIRVVKDLPEKSSSRRDYSYNNGHKFLLKQRSSHQMQGKDIVLSYEWKVCFPDTPLLHSFKHNQKVYIEGISKDLQIKIITDNYHEEQLFIRSKFYKEIEDMNTKISEFIVQTFQKQANIFIQPQNVNNNSMQSCDIIIDQVNLEQRESKYDKGQNTLRNSRLQRQKSNSALTNK